MFSRMKITSALRMQQAGLRRSELEKVCASFLTSVVLTHGS